MWRGYGQTDIGRVRMVNQDALSLHDDVGMWIVADGMGGHAGGEVASQLAVEAVVAAYSTRARSSVDGSAPSLQDREQWATDALEDANAAIRGYARKHRDYEGMGTTGVLAHIPSTVPTHATIAHLGDSRAYLLREQQLQLLTRDHSLIEDHIALGIVTREAAETHPLRHVLTHALGIDDEIEPALRSLALEPTDRLLLCSDGLTKMMPDDEILRLWLEYPNDLHRACNALIEEANRLGGADNVTIVLIGAE